MSTADENIIYLNNPSIASEPTFSMDDASAPVIHINHTIDDEEGNYLSSDDSPTPTAAATTSPHWIKRNYLPLTLAFLLLSGVVFAAVVFRPGGPGNPTNKVQTAQVDAITRGTDITSDGDDNVLMGRPTYFPTYTPTTGAVETEIPVPDTVVPTPTPTVPISTPFPTNAPVVTKPTFSPNFWGLFDPTAGPTEAPVTAEPTDTPTAVPTVTPTGAPTVSNVPTVAPVTDTPTMVPTLNVTGQVTESVSTEVTGPPTAAGREP